MLARREHSYLELCQKLSNYQRDEITQALDKLQVQNYQSDTRFATEFVQMRVNQGKGSVLIKQQLKQRGIEDFDFKNHDFFALAKSVRIRKYGEQAPKNYTNKAKQMRFLQSRGFGFDEINEAMRV